MNWKDQQEKSKDKKQDVKLLLDIMKNEFNRPSKKEEGEEDVGTSNASTGSSTKQDEKQNGSLVVDEDEQGDPGTPNTEVDTCSTSSSTIPIAIDKDDDRNDTRLDSRSESAEDIIRSCDENSAVCELSLSVNELLNAGKDNNIVVKKRSLRNRSSTRSDVEISVSCRKRSARRWSKEGESVLQNAIARKEKSLSSIGHSEEDKALKCAVVRSLRESKATYMQSRARSKSRGRSLGTLETRSEPRSKSRSSKSPSVCSDSLKMDCDVDGSEMNEENRARVAVVKSQSKAAPSQHTKPVRRKAKYYKGLKYSFHGTKRSKVTRRDRSRGRLTTRTQESVENNSRADTVRSEEMSAPTHDKYRSRSESPAVGDVCAPKTKRIRRDDLTRSPANLTPSPSLADMQADPCQPESTAISFGAGTAALCLCQSTERVFRTVEATDEISCRALDSVDGRFIGCSNPIPETDSAKLFRPSGRVPYMSLCEQHRQRLLRHNCCPGCGKFCTQGRFAHCSAMHQYHRECQLTTGKKPQCPHCGLDSPDGDTSITIGLDNYPVFLPNQKILRRKCTARITVWTKKIAAAAEEEEKTSLASELAVSMASSLLDKGEREKLGKMMNSASSVRNEGRSGHSQRFTSKNLYQSARAGDAEKIIQILKHGVNPNHVHRELAMKTALHAAAKQGHTLAVHVLVQAGAQLDAKDAELLTPLMLAAQMKRTRTVEYLVKAGACITHQGADGKTALHFAARGGDLKSCYALLTGSKVPTDFVNIKDDGGWTSLVWSSEFRHPDVVRFLLEKGADPHISDVDGNIALHWAAYSGSEDVCRMLLAHGCDVNSQNNVGDTPLHIAARQGHEDCVTICLTHGIDLTLRNKAGKLALDCAVQNNDCYAVIHTTLELRKNPTGSRTPTHRILSNDITKGKERYEIQCINGVDNEGEPSDYVYITENCFTSPILVDRTLTSLKCCTCVDMCISSSCLCARKLTPYPPYDSKGRLSSKYDTRNPPFVFECNPMCSCNAKMCKNRVVQHGSNGRFQLYRTKQKGWGVKTLTLIPKGTYVCEYVGEIVSDLEADHCKDDSYLFDLKGDMYCIDAFRYGNISRFINHMCAPNLFSVQVFTKHQDLRFPRVFFFASRDILANEELGHDYGEKFWAVKCKSFRCSCGAPSCNYSESTYQATIDSYNQRMKEEASA